MTLRSYLAVATIAFAVALAASPAPVLATDDSYSGGDSGGASGDTYSTPDTYEEPSGTDDSSSYPQGDTDSDHATGSDDYNSGEAPPPPSDQPQ
jgi:hypothetical protein